MPFAGFDAGQISARPNEISTRSAWWLSIVLNIRCARMMAIRISNVPRHRAYQSYAVAKFIIPLIERKTLFAPSFQPHEKNVRRSPPMRAQRVHRIRLSDGMPLIHCAIERAARRNDARGTVDATA